MKYRICRLQPVRTGKDALGVVQWAETETVVREGLSREDAERLHYALKNDLRTCLRRFVIEEEGR